MTKSRWQSGRVTIKDIARAAEVDPSTVTRALQGSERVKAATRARIVALAEKMGYVPNIAARTLVTASSGLIGVVIPDLTNPFFAALGRGIEDEAARHGLRVLIHDTRGVEAAEREGIDLFLQLKVDGLIVPMARIPQEFYDNLPARLPIVHVNRDEAPHHVSCDRVGGARAVMNHLLDLGHRRIAFVVGPHGPGVEPKSLAYREALEAAGLDYDPQLIFAFDGNLQSCAPAVDQLLALDERPTAIFAHNDINAIGLIHALRNQGVTVPRDISVAGHDDIDISGCIDPPLTTVAWPMYELGQHSVRYLVGLGRGGKPRMPEVSAPKLIVRESTGRPAAARAV